MPDDMMARIRAQQAQETDRANALRRQKEAEYAAANAVFRRESADVLSILRQRRIAPTQVYSCDQRVDYPYFRHFKFEGMGWSMVGDYAEGYMSSVSNYVLMDAGYLLHCHADHAASPRPRRYRDVLAVTRPTTPMWTWCTITDVPGKVRKLIGE